jgi:hypothetical protein
VRLSARSLVQSTFARWAAMSRFSEGLPPSSWVWNALAGRLWGRTGWPHFLPASLDCTDVHARTGPPSAAAPPATNEADVSTFLRKQSSSMASLSTTATVTVPRQLLVRHYSLLLSSPFPNPLAHPLSFTQPPLKRPSTHTRSAACDSCGKKDNKVCHRFLHLPLSSIY